VPPPPTCGAAVSLPSAALCFPACPPRRKQSPWANLVMGGATGTVAATVCYPLDTIRRRMQMKGQVYRSQVGSEAGQRAYPRQGWSAYPPLPSV
jgi:hypothetical protein